MKKEIDWRTIKKEKQKARLAEKDKRRIELVNSMTPEELNAYDKIHMEFR